MFSGIAIGFCAGAASTYFCIGYKERKYSKDPASSPSFPVPESALETASYLAPFGYPQSNHIVLEFSNYFAVGYNNRLKVSTWAYERLTKDSVKGNADRYKSPRFFEDKNIPHHYRSKDSDYKRSGYDRGHLVPAADLKHSQDGMDQTFVLSNICPQNPWLNRNYWSKLENFVRNLVSDNYFDEVHTVTGPLFLPDEKGWIKYPVIGKGKVAVPTHFYKVIAAQKANDTYLGAFLVPNHEFPEDKPLRDFIVPVRTIEILSGHKFFPKLAQPNEVKLIESRSKNKTSEKELCTEIECSFIARKAKNAINRKQKQAQI